MQPSHNDHSRIDALPAPTSFSTTRALRDSARSAGTRALRRRCLDTEIWRGARFYGEVIERVAVSELPRRRRPEEERQG
jgi:hypothetical protein